MKISTIFRNKVLDKRHDKFIKYTLSLIFWLLVWQILSMVVDQEILLVSPLLAVKTMFVMVADISFWQSIFNSFVRVFLGLFLGFVLGTGLAIMSYRSRTIKILLEPLILTIQTVPVVSFIIIFLIWIKPSNLSVLVSFLMVSPIFYRNVYGGLSSIDREILDLARVYKVSTYKKIRYIYFSRIETSLRSACEVGLGFCWKSGIAAEVIGMPTNTIGEKLYESKIYLNTSQLFAWTITIILLSLLFKWVFMKVLGCIFESLEL